MLHPLCSSEEDKPNAGHQVCISAGSSAATGIILGPSSINNAASDASSSGESIKVMHRKWVKLRTRYCSEDFLSASRLLFHFYSEQRHKVDSLNKGCELQEVSAWIEDEDFEQYKGTG